VSILELARLVAEMRAAQREYFRTRSTDALARSKSLERRVDEEVAGVLRPERQRSMF
jgi:hypothetical protein